MRTSRRTPSTIAWEATRGELLIAWGIAGIEPQEGLKMLQRFRLEARPIGLPWYLGEHRCRHQSTDTGQPGTRAHHA
jgi:hypothetical protein